MQGNLKDMHIVDLIQHTCEDRKTAQLTITNDRQTAVLSFKDGNVVHAEMGDETGEEVVYQLLGWEEGSFQMDIGVEPVAETITRSWMGLLLKGAQLMDESNKETHEKEETKPMAKKKKAELLAETLDELLKESADIAGAAIVGMDGLVYSANVPDRALDEDMVGAAAAAVIGLSKRSVQQLKRGNFTQTLIQGDEGNIVVAGLDSESLFVGLTPKGVNLGMAFAEVRTFTSRLREIM